MLYYYKISNITNKMNSQKTLKPNKLKLINHYCMPMCHRPSLDPKNKDSWIRFTDYSHLLLCFVQNGVRLSTR